MLAYSYERVMPGPDYFDSVRSYWRVYAGETRRRPTPAMPSSRGSSTWTTIR